MQALLSVSVCLCLFSCIVGGAEEELLQEIHQQHASLQHVSGQLRDRVRRLDEQAEEGAEQILDIAFWFSAPRCYHFIVRQPGAEDQEHYLSNGEQRWHVEVVLDQSLVDVRPSTDDDLFARIQDFIQLDQQRLSQDFQLAVHSAGDADALASLKLMQEWVIPESWQADLLLHLKPQSASMRADLVQVILVFDAERRMRGLLIDDTHHNRREVEIRSFNAHESLDPALFTWSE